MSTGLALSANANIAGAVRALTLKNRYTSFLDQRAYPIADWAHTVRAPGGFDVNTSTLSIEKKVQLAKHVGAFRKEKQFEEIGFVRGPATTTMSVKRARYVSKDEVYDREEMNLNRNTESRILNYVKQQAEAASKARVEAMEDKFLFGENSLAEYEDEGFEGLLTLAGLSMNQTTGAYVALTEPAFVGRNQRFRNGDVRVNNKWGINPNGVNNGYWANMVGTTTADGITFDVAMMIERIKALTGFTPSKMHVKGEGELGAGKEISRWSVFCGLNDKLSYQAALSTWRERADGDMVVSADSMRVAQLGLTSVPGLDNDPLRRILAINNAHVGMYKIDEFWDQDIEVSNYPDADMKYCRGKRYCGQILCDNPRAGLWVIHRPYS